jgi:predicted ABC-type transport system involved in lysophospholipase L1 biosynthesis ATPase subunit
MTLKGDHNKDYIKKRAIELLNKVGLSERINHFPNQLSGGEQ